MKRFLPFVVLPLVLCVACGESDAPAPAPEHAGMDHGKKADHADMDHGEKADAAGADKPAMYSCPMHPEVTSDSPGACPKCGMDLVMPEGHDHAAHDHGGDAAAGK
jgi:hypothetical protein